MLHPQILVDLLDGELALARQVLGARAGDLHRDGLALVMQLVRPDGTWTLKLDGTAYDAEPFDVALVGEDGDVLPLDRWIPGFALGEHPVLGRPWVCLSGTRAFYLYEGHHTERWDAVRFRHRADNLLDRLLAKAGL
ncbi:hypothetical protein [Pseudonocardia sp. TRM90224]|uniref:hypothetical protein n=1 Tax=Pseudonocardia sp. TRM90224 TaxID=2812678 RepID=UPI001E3634F3|nr:hypothetical protein [Pseudonocardia sp. TRM90224]